MDKIAKAYANLIIHGRKTLDDVPEKLRQRVKEILGIVDEGE